MITRDDYFGQHDDLQNSFQLILTDRRARNPGDFDVEFRYGPSAVGYSSGPYLSARITEAGLYSADGQHVSVVNARVVEGTSIRFVPR